MKKSIVFFGIFILIFFFCLQCNTPGSSSGSDGGGGSSTSSFPLSSFSFTIIADHTVVDLYNTIPQYWIDEVKNMLVDIAGESHSEAYRTGMDLLEGLDNRFEATTFDGTPPILSVTDPHVRLGRHGSTGEEDFYTNQTAIDNIKQLINNLENTGNPLHVIGLGWCWDMDRNSCTATRDPVYNVGWAGSSAGGPQGDLPWGLDGGDQAITGNSICMDTYINAILEYREYCNNNNYQCVPIFTTGPVDSYNGSQNGFQREIKHDYIRNYVNTNGGILFDYADILCYNDAGQLSEYTWNDGGTPRVHRGIHPDNNGGGGTGHIGEVGALRLAKAMWWLLARISGWDGNP